MVRTYRKAALLGVLALVTGCSSITEHRGYIVDEALLQAVQPGIDNRTSVEGTLGRPTFTSQFGQPTLGRDRGFLEDLFGNIGQVGAAGMGGGAAPGP